MSDKLREVQEKLNQLNIEYDRLNDEWSAKLVSQQEEFQREKNVSEAVLQQ